MWKDSFEMLESADAAETCCNITHRDGVYSGMMFAPPCKRLCISKDGYKRYRESGLSHN